MLRRCSDSCVSSLQLETTLATKITLFTSNHPFHLTPHSHHLMHAPHPPPRVHLLLLAGALDAVRLRRRSGGARRAPPARPGHGFGLAARPRPRNARLWRGRHRAAHGRPLLGKRHARPQQVPCERHAPWVVVGCTLVGRHTLDALILLFLPARRLTSFSLFVYLSLSLSFLFLRRVRL